MIKTARSVRMFDEWQIIYPQTSHYDKTMENLRKTIFYPVGKLFLVIIWYSIKYVKWMMSMMVYVMLNHEESSDYSLLDTFLKDYLMSFLRKRLITR